MMNEKDAIKWAVHHMVVDYYHKLIDSVKKDVKVPKLKFEDFLPVAQERVEALIPIIVKNKMSCVEEAKKIISWKCREQVEIEIIGLTRSM